MLKENFITTKIIEVLDKEKCSLCRLDHQHNEKYISDLIYQYNSDQIIINKFINSLGFCPEHNQLLIKLIKKNHLLSRSNIAKLYENTIPAYLDLLEKNTSHHENPFFHNIVFQLNKLKQILKKQYKKRSLQESNCMCCLASQKETEDNILTLIEILLDEEYRQLYKSGDGLCIPHFKKVVNFIDDNGVISPVKGFLLKDQEERLELLQYRLQRLQEKKRYDNDEIISEAEALSWHEAIWRFSGWKPDSLKY